MTMPSDVAGLSGSSVNPAEIEKFSRFRRSGGSARQNGAAAQDQSAAVAFIRDAACRKFDRNGRSLNCLSICGCSISLRRGPVVRAFGAAGAPVIVASIRRTAISRRARLHADKSHVSIDNRCTTLERHGTRVESFDIVLAMESCGARRRCRAFLARCASVLKPGGLRWCPTLNRTWKSYRAGDVVAENVLRWLPRGTIMGQFVTPETGASSGEVRARITEQAGVVYSPVRRSLEHVVRHRRQLHGGGGRHGVRRTSGSGQR